MSSKWLLDIYTTIRCTARVGVARSVGTTDPWVFNLANAVEVLTHRLEAKN